MLKQKSNGKEKPPDRVSEYTHPRATDIILGKTGQRNQTNNWDGMEKVQESTVYTGRQIPQTRDKEMRLGTLHIPGPVIRRPNMVTQGEQDVPYLSSEDETENNACCVERQTDEC